jgi:hypothetical protein
MKKLFLTITLVAGLPLLGACTKSVNQAQHDVQRAHDRAVQNIEQKQQELNDTKRDAVDRIAQKERRLEDTARQETDNIRKEERALDDAVRTDVRREEARRSETSPASTSLIPPE